MAVYKNSKKIKDIYVNDSKIGKIYKGNNLVYFYKKPEFTFTFTFNGGDYVSGSTNYLYFDLGNYAAKIESKYWRSLTFLLHSAVSAEDFQMLEIKSADTWYNFTVTTAGESLVWTGGIFYGNIPFVFKQL